MLDKLPDCLKVIIDVFRFLSGLRLFVVLGPICFLTERSVTYYLYKTNPNHSSTEKEVKLRKFRKETKQMAFGIALAFIIAFALPDSPNKLLFLYAMPIYYAYAAAITIEFIWVWLSRRLRDG